MAPPAGDDAIAFGADIEPLDDMAGGVFKTQV